MDKTSILNGFNDLQESSGRLSANGLVWTQYGRSYNVLITKTTDKEANLYIEKVNNDASVIGIDGNHIVLVDRNDLGTAIK